MTDKFFFHSKSAPAAPGKGVNERLVSGKEYQTLVQNPHWRRALSNFWTSPFNLDGHRWNTVEHYFQAQKLYIAEGPERDIGARGDVELSSRTFEDTALFRMFCMDCKQEYMARFNSYAISTSDGSVAQRFRKLTKLTSFELSLWDSRKEAVMQKAQYAKFSQNPTLKAILLATGDAELWHGAARQPAARMFSLEAVRAALSSGTELLEDE